MHRSAAAVLLWGAVTLGACSSEQLAASRDASVDTPTGVDAAGLDAAVDRCSGSLGEVGRGCQASFDGTAADLPACSGLSQTVKLCDGLIALGLWGGFTGLTCYYDATTHLLVGALEVSDSPGFCGDSFGRFAGQIQGPSCDSVTPDLNRSCTQDGGAG